MSRRELEQRVDSLEREVEHLRNRVEPDCRCRHNREAHTNPGLGPKNPPGHCYIACGCHAYAPQLEAADE